MESVSLPSPVLMRESVRVESVETQDWVRGSLRHSMSVQSGIWDKRSALLEDALSQIDSHIIQETRLSRKDTLTIPYSVTVVLATS